MEYKDYYKILGVERTASEADIKKAYRRLAQKYHPDISKEKNAEEKFKEVNEAYQTLSDPQKKAIYDQGGQDPSQGFEQSGRASYGGFDPRSGAHFEFHGGDFDFADLFGAMGRRTASRQQAFPGEDLETTVELSPEQAYRGTTVGLSLREPQEQNGKVVLINKTLEVKIPQGTIDGQRLRLQGKGGAGYNGGPNGNLYVTINIKDDGKFKVEGRDIYLAVPLAPYEAVLGAEVVIPTIDGRKVSVKIKPGTKSGQKIRLAGKGFPNKNGPNGDFYLVANVVVPAEPTEKEKDLYRQLAETSKFEPRVAL